MGWSEIVAWTLCAALWLSGAPVMVWPSDAPRWTMLLWPAVAVRVLAAVAWKWATADRRG